MDHSACGRLLTPAVPRLPSFTCICRKSSQLNADTLSLIALSFGQLFVLSLLLGAAVGLFSAWFIKRTFVQ